MKKILMVFLLCFVFELNAQTLVYDYHTGIYTSDLACAKKGSNVVFQIININLFAKKAKIESELTIVSTDIPAEIASAFRLTNEAEKKLENIDDQIQEMSDVQNDAADKANKLSATPTTAKKATVKVIAAIQNEAKEVENLVDNCYEYYERAEKIKDATNFKKVLAETMGNGNYFNEVSMQKALSERGINSKQIYELWNDYDAFIISYDKVNYQYNIASGAAVAAGDNTHAVKIKNAQEHVKNDHLILKQQYLDILNSITDLYYKAINPANYIFKADKDAFIEDDTDELTFLISTGNLNDELSTIKSFKKQIRIEGGVKIDFSVGFVFRSIVDHKFYLDSSKKLQKRGYQYIDHMTPDLTSMVYIYTRTCKDVALGGMFGLSAGFKGLSDINLGFQGGGSALISTRSNIVIVSAGLSYSLVNRLKGKQFEIGNIYSDTEFKIEDVSEKILRPSFFFAVSMAIPKRKVVK